MRRNSAPAVQRSEQAVDGCLQLRRVVAHVAGFSEHLINDGVKCDHAPGELAALGFRFGQLRLSQIEQPDKSTHDLGRKSCK